MRRPGLISREIKNPVTSVHMGFGKFGLSWYPWRYSIKSMSRNILDVKVWGPKESKESKTLTLTQESRSKTASVIDLRNWTGQLIPHQICDACHADRLSQGEQFTEGQRKADLRGWVASLSLQHLRQGHSSLHWELFLDWTTWVICSIFFPFEPKYNLLPISAFWNRKKHICASSHVTSFHKFAENWIPRALSFPGSSFLAFSAVFVYCF